MTGDAMASCADMTSYPVALVTGGARRIGAATCRHLHRHGFNIIVHYHNASTCAKQLVQELNAKRADSAKMLHADLNDVNHITLLAKDSESAWGHIDALINNASSFYPTPVSSADEQQWNDLIGTNLKAPFFLSQQLRPALEKTAGCIVNIADIFAERPMPNHAIYSIAKAGNAMLTQALALEFAPNIRVNSVAPGAILWPEDASRQEVVNNDKLKAIPLGRLGGAEVIAQSIHTLISFSPYTTGQIIKVDGGISLL